MRRRYGGAGRESDWAAEQHAAAALVCAFSFGTNCDDILNQLIAQACRGSAG
jgi:hypothetical protein